MCPSTPKVKPVSAAPEVAPESIDEAAVTERDRERQRQRLRAGRTSTILAGDTSSTMPTASVKTALGG
ncbi:hypothetical protein, partial [Enterobacter hormaechei]|uniref:hypothetical protein n=1 Tax=Enterobacter hormaechei TaxID=158836 RepID=UPI00203F44BE